MYLDDILAYTDTWEEHLKHIRKVLEKLRQQKVYAKIAKCCFGAQELDYLGCILLLSADAVDPIRKNH